MTAGQRTAVDRIENTEHLEDLLSAPTEAAVAALTRLEGDLIVLGVAGKMGPTLGRMARRASEQAGVRRRIIGVARFTDARHEARLQAHGVETIRCDLLDRTQLARLPEVPNVVYMAGMKFGATGQEARTWAMNCLLPALVCEKYRQARIVAFSTGNVYGLAPVRLGGSLEGEAATAGRVLATLARESRATGSPWPRGTVVVACGGEYTVNLGPDADRLFGRGGPSQEAAVGAALALDGVPGIVALFADTDGSDGGTAIAGESSLRSETVEELPVAIPFGPETK